MIHYILFNVSKLFSLLDRFDSLLLLLALLIPFNTIAQKQDYVWIGGYWQNETWGVDGWMFDFVEYDGVLSNAQKTRIGELANMCAYHYPKSVSLSRGVYQMLTPDQVITYSDDCTESKIRSFENKNLVQNIQVYPNPAKTSITIMLDKKNLVSETEFFIYNGTGELMIKEKTMKSTIDVNLTDLRNGIYFISTSTGKTARFIKID